VAEETVSQPSLSISLEQALQTEEKEKIEAVFQHTDVAAVTIAKLDTAKIAPLLRQLQSRFAQVSKVCAGVPF
jgi:hypothetical protein